MRRLGTRENDTLETLNPCASGGKLEHKFVLLHLIGKVMVVGVKLGSRRSLR